MSFTHPHFAEPKWLWLAVLAPLGVFLLFRFAAWARRRQIAQFAAPELLADLLRSHSPARRALKNFLLLLTVWLMALALARPQWGEQPEQSRALGEDILFILDSSRSMTATDVRPSRMERSKLAILDFVQRHGRGRVGLVAFAGQAFLQCPLTFDYDSFRESLMAVDERSIPVLGTDLGRALDEAFLGMEKDDRRKIMVLLTDGEDLEKTGIRKAQDLGSKGVVVFTVGVGTPAGSPITILTPQGTPDFLRDARGDVVTSRLDEPTLRAVAEATRGGYQPLGAVGEGMTQIRRLVEGATEMPGLSKARKLGIDRFHVFIALILVLLVVESLIGTRRRLETGAAA